jgi:hypothetical protein
MLGPTALCSVSWLSLLPLFPDRRVLGQKSGREAVSVSGKYGTLR